MLATKNIFERILGNAEVFSIFTVTTTSLNVKVVKVYAMKYIAYEKFLEQFLWLYNSHVE